MVFTLVNSSRLFVVHSVIAAKWTTQSQPTLSRSRRTRSTLRTSPRKIWMLLCAFSSSTLGGLLPGKSNTVTRALGYFEASPNASCDPMYPKPPVISTLFMTLSLLSPGEKATPSPSLSQPSPLPLASTHALSPCSQTLSLIERLPTADRHALTLSRWAEREGEREREVWGCCH